MPPYHDPLWPNGGSGAICRDMKVTVKCPACGAVYEREEHMVVMRWRDPFNCQICGHEIEGWTSSRKATFKLLRRGQPAADNQS